jgi:hypothetical protein
MKASALVPATSAAAGTHTGGGPSTDASQPAKAAECSAWWSSKGCSGRSTSRASCCHACTGRERREAGGGGRGGAAGGRGAGGVEGWLRGRQGCCRAASRRGRAGLFFAGGGRAGQAHPGRRGLIPQAAAPGRGPGQSPRAPPTCGARTQPLRTSSRSCPTAARSASSSPGHSRARGSASAVAAAIVACALAPGPRWVAPRGQARAAGTRVGRRRCDKRGALRTEPATDGVLRMFTTSAGCAKGRRGLPGRLPARLARQWGPRRSASPSLRGKNGHSLKRLTYERSQALWMLRMRCNKAAGRAPVSPLINAAPRALICPTIAFNTSQSHPLFKRLARASHTPQDGLLPRTAPWQRAPGRRPSHWRGEAPCLLSGGVGVARQPRRGGRCRRGAGAQRARRGATAPTRRTQLLGT